VLLTMLAIGILVGCSQTNKSPDVSDSIRKSLDEANLKTVSVKQDRDKGVVTLGGHVPADVDKTQAESIAKSIAGAQVVADQIAVVLTGAESDVLGVKEAGRKINETEYQRSDGRHDSRSKGQAQGDSRPGYWQS
jgi:hypothetical protein